MRNFDNKYLLMNPYVPKKAILKGIPEKAYRHLRTMQEQHRHKTGLYMSIERIIYSILLKDAKREEERES